MLSPLSNLPRVQSDLNTFFISPLALPPSSQSTARPTKKFKLETKSKVEADLDVAPEWMAAYDSASSSDSEPTETKRSRGRLSNLNMHTSIHSVTSHISQYTSLWEMVFAKVTLDTAWTRKILLGLHGKDGILSHWKPERRVGLADWLGELADGGGVGGMLAMNGLYALMTQYNL